MKERVFGLFIGICMLAGSSCFAMQFSSVEEMEVYLRLDAVVVVW